MNNKTLDIETFMRYYIPKGWIGAIREFDFIPYVKDEEADLICSGIIPDDKKFTEKWYIVAALKDWMIKNNIKYSEKI